jgi:5'-deoxynucleotidase YfbR-like HD superfamily hydrolase
MSLNFYKYVCKLGSVKRFAVDNLKYPYSVAEHSYRVAMLSMIIVDDYNLNSEQKINPEVVIRKSLIHDLEEVKMGDIPSPAKNINKTVKKYLREIGEELMESVILKGLPKKIRDEYLLFWKTDKDGESGEIIELADKLEGLYQSIKEVNASNDELEESLVSHIEFFESKKGKELLLKYKISRKIYNDMLESVKNNDIIKKVA